MRHPPAAARRSVARARRVHHLRLAALRCQLGRSPHRRYSPGTRAAAVEAVDTRLLRRWPHTSRQRRADSWSCIVDATRRRHPAAMSGRLFLGASAAMSNLLLTAVHALRSPSPSARLQGALTRSSTTLTIASPSTTGSPCCSSTRRALTVSACLCCRAIIRARGSTSRHILTSSVRGLSALPPRRAVRTFATAAEESAALIYNYPAVYTAPTEPSFEQCYFFD
jgi:hypothetical protein